MIKKILPAILFVVFLVTHSFSFAQGEKYPFTLNWQGVQSTLDIKGLSVNVLGLEGGSYLPQNNYAPVFNTVVDLPRGVERVEPILENAVFQNVDATQLAWITNPVEATSDLKTEYLITTHNGISTLRYTVYPFRIYQGTLQQLVSFDLKIIDAKQAAAPAAVTYAVSKPSVLATGTWYKIRLNKTGVYKFTYDDIKAMGVNMSKVTPANIRLFGQGSMMPENVEEFYYDGLPENAIQVVTANPNVFSSGDYILFYATGPDLVYFDNIQTNNYTHRKNPYSNYSYYFLNFDTGPGKRLENLAQSPDNPYRVMDRYIDYQYFDKDLFNTGKSGQRWVGDKVDPDLLAYTFPSFYFPNAIPGSAQNSYVDCRLVRTSLTRQRVNLLLNGSKIHYADVSSHSSDDYGAEAKLRVAFVPATEGENRFKAEIGILTPGTAPTFYVDYISTNVITRLQYTSGYLQFSNALFALDGIFDVKLAKTNNQVAIWEVTDPHKVKKVDHIFQSDTSRFVMQMQNNVLRTFVAWDNTGLLKPEYVEKIANQDILSLSNVEMLIVAPKAFLSEARRLADHHRSFDGLTVEVVEEKLIFNEFSSGSPDPTAIRDFCRFLYDRPDSERKLRYLLLFGKATYDVRNIQVHTQAETVSTYETYQSLNAVTSCATDDYFGVLSSKTVIDPVTCGLKEAPINIGIGRFPVVNLAEAKIAVKKTIDYATQLPKQFGPWRNVAAFVADDEDFQTYALTSEDTLVPRLLKNAPEFNVSKIYLDAYKQEITPSGPRYPAAKQAIDDQIKNGVLIMNYSGHGGNEGWAEEAVLDRTQISNWTNYKSMPVFITATCEFSHYDNPDKKSPGEEIFLNLAGGGIALYSTSRATFAPPNLILNKSLYDTLFSRKSAVATRLGDAIAFGKNETRKVSYYMGYVRGFVLLGDPALEIAFPKYKVKTTAINGKPVSEEFDTLKALAPVEIEGEIVNWDGVVVSGFDGELDVKIFDKMRRLRTKGNDGWDPIEYTLQDNIVYQGKASVENGKFKLSFILPQDINFSYGCGKISYYANSNKEDATGEFEDFIIGGISDQSLTDTTPPKISLFINNEQFQDGGMTHENPLLIAKLFDENGVSTVGTAIGHDITAVLDNNASQAISLNKYYKADLNSYQSGTVYFQFKNLTKGEHTLTVKVWDVFNNSAEATITFIVDKNFGISITSIKAYPNPFVDNVNIYFEHNKYNVPLETTVEVFAVNGQKIWQYGPTREYVSEGYVVGPIYWDGHDGSGNSVDSGMYLCRIRVKDNQNKTADKTIKLIKLQQ